MCINGSLAYGKERRSLSSVHEREPQPTAEVDHEALLRGVPRALYERVLARGFCLVHQTICGLQQDARRREWRTARDHTDAHRNGPLASLHLDLQR